MGTLTGPPIAVRRNETSPPPEGRLLIPQICLRLLLPLLLLFAAGAQARTPSGTRIANTVLAAWSNAAGSPYSASAAVTNTVSDFIDFSVTSVTGRALIGTVTALPFTLTNANNFSDIFRFLTVSNTWPEIQTRVHWDANGDGVIGPGEPALTNSPPFGEGAAARFLFALTVPSSFPPGRTNVTILSIGSLRSNTMRNSRILITNRFVSSAWSNSVSSLSASDGIRTISDFGGSAYLADTDIRITVRLGKTPNDTSSVRLWYDTSAEPDGSWGPSTTDRSVPLVFDGTDWTAVIPASDPAVTDGQLIRFVVESDNIVYTPPSASSWRFLIKARPDQGAGFNVFPTIIDLSQSDQLAMTYRIGKRSEVTLTIYDLKGELVQTFREGMREAGYHATLHWDGMNHAGRPVAAGLYFVHIRAQGLDETRKVIIIK